MQELDFPAAQDGPATSNIPYGTITDIQTFEPSLPKMILQLKPSSKSCWNESVQQKEGPTVLLLADLLHHAKYTLFA